VFPATLAYCTVSTVRLGGATLGSSIEHLLGQPEADRLSAYTVLVKRQSQDTHRTCASSPPSGFAWLIVQPLHQAAVMLVQHRDDGLCQDPPVLCNASNFFLTPWAKLSRSVAAPPLQILCSLFTHFCFALPARYWLVPTMRRVKASTSSSDQTVLHYSIEPLRRGLPRGLPRSPQTLARRIRPSPRLLHALHLPTA